MDPMDRHHFVLLMGKVMCAILDRNFTLGPEGNDVAQANKYPAEKD